MSRSLRPRCAALCVVALAAIGAACSGDGGDGAPTAPTPPSTTARTATTTTAVGTPAAIVLNGQGNHLDAYGSEPDADGTFATQRVITSAAEDPAGGRDVNGQVCVLGTGDGGTRFIAGEDTGQPDRPAGWGIFELSGDRIGDLRARQVGKLVPTYQASTDGPENYGCGVLSDGRVLTTDVGNQAGGDGDGQLIVWFPPFEGGRFPDFAPVRYCKLDVGLPTAQSILVGDDDTVYVAAARAGVFRYRGPFPSSDDPAGGCGRTDATGAPLADAVDKELFIAPGAHGMATPAGLAPAPDGGFYVSSVFTGVINEYGPDGGFRRTILQPPEGEQLGERPFSTGTPLGLAVDAAGTLYYADIGIVISGDGVGPGRSTGTVRRIRLVDGTPQPPEVMGSGLAFPDGVGVWVPR